MRHRRKSELFCGHNQSLSYRKMFLIESILVKRITRAAFQELLCVSGSMVGRYFALEVAILYKKVNCTKPEDVQFHSASLRPTFIDSHMQRHLHSTVGQPNLSTDGASHKLLCVRIVSLRSFESTHTLTTLK